MPESKDTRVSNQRSLAKDVSTGKSKFIIALTSEAKPENKYSVGIGVFIGKLK